LPAFFFAIQFGVRLSLSAPIPIRKLETDAIA
jgi:hypothetical protein